MRKPAEGLVQQDDPRTSSQGPGEGNALLLPAGQLVRSPAADLAGQADEVEQLGDPSRATPVAAGQAEADVLLHREVREESALLGDVADAAILRCDEHAGRHHRVPADGHRPRIRAMEAGDHPKQGRLATTRRTEDGRRRPGGDVKVHSVQDRRRTVRGDDIAHHQLGHEGSFPSRVMISHVSGADTRIIARA